MIGADETVVRVKGVKTVVGVVTDAETGRVLGLDVLVERIRTDSWGGLATSRAVTGSRRWPRTTLARISRRSSVWESTIRFCVTHVRKRARNRLDKIDGWNWVKARMWRPLTELPTDGDSELLRLERAARDGDATLRRKRRGGQAPRFARPRA